MNLLESLESNQQSHDEEKTQQFYKFSALQCQEDVPNYQQIYKINNRPLKLSLLKEQIHQESNNYISSFITKFNPDLLIPGGALPGNMYFKQKNESNQVEEGEKLLSESDQSSNYDDDYKKLKTQVTRYYADENPTIKCRNCRQFGHFGKDCPNDRQRLNCILCGKDTHDSFECAEKLCFKCNKVGHKASECDQKNIDVCVLCNMAGHNRFRCLKVWANYTSQLGIETRFTQSQKFMRCTECGETGHLKCTSGKKSSKIKLNFKIKTDRLIFHRYNENSLSENSSSQESEDESADSLQEIKSSCAACGYQRHDVTECNDKRGNQKYVQFENVRAKFARDISLNYKKKHNDYGQRDNNQEYGNYNRRLQQDPRSQHNESYNYVGTRRDFYHDNKQSRGEYRSRDYEQQSNSKTYRHQVHYDNNKSGKYSNQEKRQVSLNNKKERAIQEYSEEDEQLFRSFAEKAEKSILAQKNNKTTVV